MTSKELRQGLSWYIKCSLSRMKWQHTVAFGLLSLWALLIGVVDLPLRAEVRKMGAQLSSYISQPSINLFTTERNSVERDLSNEFIASLPEFEKHLDELRALNVLADKADVLITRTDYHYEQISTLPIRKLSLRMEVSGDDAQQRRFLQTMMNSFPNLSIARLAYAKRADGSARIEQKLDVNLYYRLANAPT